MKALADSALRESAVSGTTRRVFRTSSSALTPQGADSITANAAVRLKTRGLVGVSWRSHVSYISMNQALYTKQLPLNIGHVTPY